DKGGEFSIMPSMSHWKDALTAAVEAGEVLESSLENIELLLAGTSSPVAEAAIAELVAGAEWAELNDRFFKTLAFGTGGLRGRTVGRVVTQAEQGAGGPLDRPEHPCVGTATMNFFNLKRAMIGMVRFLKQRDPEGRPSVVLGHDSRHFSRDFAETCARVCTDLGCDAYLFESARSTPEVSFAIRELRATAGVVLTASHNPSHDNGFKAYFSDGAQVLDAEAKLIIAEVNALQSEDYEALPASGQGELKMIGEEIDEKYMAKLRSVLLKPELLEGRQAKVVYTNLHGTGGVIIVPMLQRLGFDVITVPEQDGPDGRFPTVESPNPENGPALAMAIELAEKEGADVVIGTDPDNDRMGVAVRNAAGEMELLSGNQIGSLMAWYRSATMFELGWITESNRSRATLIKTYVTTELQSAIARKYGIGIVNTLTGFKYIAEKLGKYEKAIPATKFEGDYRDLSEEESRRLRLEYSKFFVFGGEESYGYLGADFVRDKDGNASAVMFAELAAYALSQGKTIADLRDELWAEFGVHLEAGKSMVMEGAEGAAKIKALAESYSENPPQEVDGVAVERVRDFSKGGFFDEEGDEIPVAAMLFVELADGRSFAVRPSGTEPKIKYYLYGKSEPGDVATGKAAVSASLDALWQALEADARERVG
ncbi:MAG: phospho-sugar mutase, partial [Verrucomicrobiales bacterium]